MIALDVGGTKVLGVLFDKKRKIVHQVKVKTKAEEGKKVVFEQICFVIDELLKFNKKPVSAIGAGVPGIIEKSGNIAFSPNIPWKNYNLKEKLEKKYKIATYIGNDVNTGVLGEWKFGAGKKSKNIIGMFLGTGIGGGLIINGKLHEGETGAAGEIGHICINPQGPYCGCGSRGCLEAYASKKALIKEIHAQIRRGKKSILSDALKENPDVLKSNALKKAYLKKDKLAVELIENMCLSLAVGTASLLNILNAEKVIFGGGVIEALGDIIIPKIRKYAKRYAMPKILESSTFLAAALKDYSVIYGALYLAENKGKI